MFKKLRKNEKGFTLAELLIVVAIIGVLVAISIPIFTTQLQKARFGTNQANARSAMSGAVADWLETDDSSKSGDLVYSFSAKTGKITPSDTAATTAISTKNDVTSITLKTDSELGSKVYDTWTVTIDKDGNIITINYNK